MPSILAPYDKQLGTDVARSYVEYQMQCQRERLEGYIQAREYYDGVHATQLTDRTRSFLKSLAKGQDFNANYCPIIVNSLADRLKLIGFKTKDESAKTFQEWWQKNRMDKVAGITHRASIRDADAFILVEYDSVAQLPRFYFEKAGVENGVMVYYSEERANEIAFASKHWVISRGDNAGKVRRLNLYFADRIEKYISNDDIAMGTYLAYEDEDTTLGDGRMGKAGIVWWTDDRTESGLPLGIPIIHFPNDDNGDGYGKSRLHDVIPVQDATNKSLIDLIATLDVEAFGLLVGTGADWTGLEVGPGAIVSTTAPKSEAGLDRLVGTDPSGMINAYNSMVMEMFRISGTPLSYAQISGQTPAEGTMKQQESTLIAQAEKAQIDFGNAWEDCMIMARRLHNAFGAKPKLSEDVLIESVWQDAQLRNELEEATMYAILVEKLGYTEEYAQEKLGVSEEDREKFAIEKMKRQADEQRMQQQLAAQKGNPNAAKQTLNQTENEANNGRASPAA